MISTPEVSPIPTESCAACEHISGIKQVILNVKQVAVIGIQITRINAEFMLRVTDTKGHLSSVILRDVSLTDQRLIWFPKFEFEFEFANTI